MTFADFQHHRDMAVFVTCMAAAVFAIAFDLGERNVTNRLRAEAACPAGPVARRVIHLDQPRVECTYYWQRPGK